MSLDDDKIERTWRRRLVLFALAASAWGLNKLIAEDQLAYFAPASNHVTLGYSAAVAKRFIQTDRHQTLVQIRSGDDRGYNEGNGVILDAQGAVAFAAHTLVKGKSLDAVLFPHTEQTPPLRMTLVFADTAHDIAIAQIVDDHGAPITPQKLAALGAKVALWSALPYAPETKTIVAIGFPSITNGRLHAAVSDVQDAPSEGSVLFDRVGDNGNTVMTCIQRTSLVTSTGMSGGPVFHDNRVVGVLSLSSQRGMFAYSTIIPMTIIRQAYAQAFPERYAQLIAEKIVPRETSAPIIPECNKKATLISTQPAG